MIDDLYKNLACGFIAATLLLFACNSHDNTDAVHFTSRGSIRLLDTLTGRYEVNSSDKKLISAWEKFIEVVAKMDSSELSKASTGCIHCSNCALGEGSPVLSFGEFYARHARTLFNDSLILSMTDSSKVAAS